MTEQELLSLKKDITDAKSEISRLEGQQEVLMKQLKETYGVSSVDAAMKKVKKLETEIEQIDEKIEAQTTELETQLEDATTESEE